MPPQLGNRKAASGFEPREGAGDDLGQPLGGGQAG